MSRHGRERQGRLAERLAALALRLKGYAILARRFASPVGEIDLVAQKGGLVVFVEVKRRPTLAAALEALTERQRQRIGRAAGLYLKGRPDLGGHAVRFDVVAVTPWRWPRHLEDAWRL